MIGRKQASCTEHVSRDDRRLSGNVLSEVPCHEAGIDVGSARRRIPDDEVDCLAAIEFFYGLSAGGRGCEEKDSADKSEYRRIAMGASAEPAGVLFGFTCRVDFHVHAS